jgi:hypothetical protein
MAGAVLLASLGMASAQTQFANFPVKVTRHSTTHHSTAQHSTAWGEGARDAGGAALPVPWRRPF